MRFAPGQEKTAAAPLGELTWGGSHVLVAGRALVRPDGWDRPRALA